VLSRKKTDNHTAMDNVVVVEVVNGFEDLPYRLRAVLFSEAALVDNTLEKLTAKSELCNNVELVLGGGVSSEQMWMP